MEMDDEAVISRWKSAKSQVFSSIWLKNRLFFSQIVLNLADLAIEYLEYTYIRCIFASPKKYVLWKK